MLKDKLNEIKTADKGRAQFVRFVLNGCFSAFVHYAVYCGMQLLIEVNVAYRWFLGLDVLDPVPHFTTFGKNYTRRFKDTDLFEQIFKRILEECYRYRLVDPSEVFVDATHVKAHANGKKMQKRIAERETLFYEEMLRKEIDSDREAH